MTKNKDIQINYMEEKIQTLNTKNKVSEKVYRGILVVCYHQIILVISL